MSTQLPTVLPKCSIDERRRAICALLDQVGSYLRSVPDMPMYAAYAKVCELMGVPTDIAPPAKPAPPAPPPPPPLPPRLAAWTEPQWLDYIRAIRANAHLYRHPEAVLARALLNMERELGPEARSRAEALVNHEAM